MKKKLAIFAPLGLIGVIVIAFLTYLAYFAVSGRALPNAHIGQLDVGGMTKAEIVTELTSNVDTAHAMISGQGINDTDANLSDMGAHLDIDATVKRVLSSHRSVPLDYFTALFSDSKVDPIVTFPDEDKLQDFARSLTEGQKSAALPTPARIEQQDGNFVVVPGSDGQGVPVSEVKRIANELAASQKSLPVSVKTVALPAQAPSEQIKKLAAQANQLRDTDVSMIVGDETITADSPTKTSWISLTDDTLSINQDLVTQWVTESSKNLLSDEIVGVRYMNNRGEVIRVGTKAVAAQTVANVEQIVSAISTNILDGKPTSQAVEVQTGEEKWDDRIVASGAENLVYLAGEGEKWIDVNLSNFTVMGYEGATAVRGPIPLVAGADETPTITGTYKIWHKTPSQTMRGTNVDGTRYETPGVPWIMYFQGDFAIHGAPWRSSFGYDAGEYGSHGCVNVSVSDAKSLYDWAPKGTVVVSHY
ncbi:L,D-transpeptidase family protein [Arcanobacterium pinnipediorum]|uniref:L,D-transpeptidase/peptidoglycan binding protein n=1 Tax=Arcanobacterium pinnipediorum TaxID=1503041 RepID=A0ABY5AIZ2_9ACTO|nr:L,D-transpeptidase family protein [Arcanobacterium pinnipediorum]USR80177.1 L,D-transpeptidase/peptidoglycan binding protein [Arcanobacterium pinnipediorum]